MNGLHNEKDAPPNYSYTSSANAPSAPNEKTGPTKFNYSTSSTAAASTPAFQSHFASISLHQTDRIRFLQFPSETLTAIRSVVASSWKFGIQEERQYAGSHEIKLKGNPWSGSSSTYAVPSHILMRNLLAYLYSIGWVIHQTVDLSKKLYDKDTIVLRKQPMPPSQSLWFSISFNRSDRLRLIGADENIIVAFQDLLKGLGLHQSEEGMTDAYEFKLVGYPWMPAREETMKMRLLILTMLETLERQGWSLYASVDQSNGNEERSETDSWHLVKEAGWVVGNPVFHR